MTRVYLLATLDTKGQEAAFVRDQLAARHLKTRIIDTGCLGKPAFTADIPREQVFAAAGTTLAAVRDKGDRGQAVTFAAAGATKLIQDLHARGKVDGVIALGGSAGTTIGTAAMRSLPLGIPKLMVSTLASGQVRHYVGDKDILMLNSVVDFCGLNRISRMVLTNAARAMIGMVGLGHKEAAPANDKPMIAASMFGVTTRCIEQARPILEKAGYEVLVFHATGSGGQAMESLIADGLFAGVLDITTTELADEMLGGVLSAGMHRLTAAGKKGVPQVVSVGALDMVNFHAPDTVPEKYKGRKFHQHNANVTLMRTDRWENMQLGEEIARKVSDAHGPTSVLLPLQGVSALDAAGQPFDDPTARTSLFSCLRESLGGVELIELDCHINDLQFAEAAASKLLELIERKAKPASSNVAPGGGIPGTGIDDTNPKR